MSCLALLGQQGKRYGLYQWKELLCCAQRATKSGGEPDFHEEKKANKYKTKQTKWVKCSPDVLWNLLPVNPKPSSPRLSTPPLQTHWPVCIQQAPPSQRRSAVRERGNNSTIPKQWHHCAPFQIQPLSSAKCCMTGHGFGATFSHSLPHRVTCYSYSADLAVDGVSHQSQAASTKIHTQSWGAGKRNCTTAQQGGGKKRWYTFHNHGFHSNTYKIHCCHGNREVTVTTEAEAWHYWYIRKQADKAAELGCQCSTTYRLPQGQCCLTWGWWSGSWWLLRHPLPSVLLLVSGLEMSGWGLPGCLDHLKQKQWVRKQNKGKKQ